MRRPPPLVCATLAAWLATAAWSAGQHNESATLVRIATEPTEAIVTCDGKLRDTAPLTLSDLAPGDHLIIARKHGYKDTRRSISLAQGQRLAVELALEPITGLLVVHSVPNGADVHVGSAFRGKTPLLLTDLPVGTHRLRFSSTGYLAKDLDVTVRDRVPQKVLAELVSDSVRLVVESDPAGAEISLNGTTRGLTPAALERIPGGDATIELTLQGFESYTQELKLTPGREESVSATLKPIPADLTIVSLPTKARIYVDDQYKGEAPVELKELKPGTVTVRAELVGYEAVERKVHLQRAKQTVEEFRLDSSSGRFEVTTEPAGVKVFVDGKEAGTSKTGRDGTDQISSPLAVPLLAAGRHEVLLTKPGYFDNKFVIDVQRDKTVPSHKKMARRFIPNYEVRTGTEVIKGVFEQVDPKGNVRLETRPGIRRTVEAADIVSHGPLRTEAAPTTP